MKIAVISMLISMVAASVCEARVTGPYGGWTVYRTPVGGTIMMPPQANNSRSLRGQGVTFSASVTVEETTVPNPEAGPNFPNQPKDKKVKKYSAWLRNCGTVDLPSKPTEEPRVRTGDHVELRLEGMGSCTVSDWRKP
jgi:hypothetical protein